MLLIHIGYCHLQRFQDRGKLRFYFLGKVVLHLPDIAELDEGPAAQIAGDC